MKKIFQHRVNEEYVKKVIMYDLDKIRSYDMSTYEDRCSDKRTTYLNITWDNGDRGVIAKWAYKAASPPKEMEDFLNQFLLKWCGE